LPRYEPVQNSNARKKNNSWREGVETSVKLWTQFQDSHATAPLHAGGVSGAERPLLVFVHKPFEAGTP
jgi:hypothetical protein